jgi:hypothetical protein
MEAVVEGSEIVVTEIVEGEACRCMCPRQVSIEISSLVPGSYHVKIYAPENINSPDVNNVLIHETDVAVGNDGHRCDDSNVDCRSLPPECPDGQVPSVEPFGEAASCWTGDCVPLESCVCDSPGSSDGCPGDATCWAATNTCGPSVR